MRFSALHDEISKVESDAIVIVAFEGEKFEGVSRKLNDALNGKIERLISESEITGKFREFTMLHNDSLATPRVLVMGIGKKKDCTPDKLRSTSGRAARILRRIKCKHIAYCLQAETGIEPGLASQSITEGTILGLYHFKKYKTSDQRKKEPVEKITIVCENGSDVSKATEGHVKGEILANATILARDLVNEPANIMTPSYFANEAQRVAKETKLEIEVFDREDLIRMDMGALMAVAQGSDEPPKMVVMKHKAGKDAPTLALVGKGITFDSGGLDIKPTDSMYRMYSDCSGACAVLGAMEAISKLNLPINVTGIMPLTENMPSGHAFRPGDIIKSKSGKTIEILSTDAEGRLILADALTYAQETNPDYIMDIATLTGGVVIALGHTVSGIMGNNQELINDVMSAGNQAGENMWQLPLFEDYLAQIHSDVADLENSGGRAASTCTAGIFLQQFINNDKPWIHLDIAGTAMIERERTPYLKKPYLPKEGGTGVGVRTMFNLAEMLARKK